MTKPPQILQPLLNDVTGVILAGGRSSRMGRDKATLEIGGTSLFENIAGVFSALFASSLIAGDRPDLSRPDLPAFADEFPGSALGGLYTGLKHADTPYIFVSACDMPFVDATLIRSLAEQRHRYDVVLPQTPAGLEPLFACYSKNCMEIMRRQLEDGNFRILDIYPQLRVRIVTEDELPENWQKALTNINTPQDYSKAAERKAMTVPVVSFVAKSGTGKTTLVEKLIREMKSRGYKIGALKHDAHRFEIDHEGKDSWRFTQAGADTTVVSSPEKMAMVKRYQVEPTVEDTLAACFADVDIVLTEGFKRSSLPKIEIHRQECRRELLCRGEFHDPSLIAVASDEPLELDVPLLDLDDIAALADFIEARFLR